ncbi:MAG: hypothetical protein AB1Z98_01585 [Nannocystaceae bacterium]
MANYKDLVDAWQEQRIKWRDYRESCTQVAAAFGKALTKALGREVRPYRAGQHGSIAWKEKLNWRNAVEVQNDGWYAVTVDLLLENGPDSFPKMAYGVTLEVKVLDDRVVLRLPNFSSLDRGVEIKKPFDEVAITDFAESVAAAMLDDLSTEFARSLESGARRRGIGFDIEG